MALSLRAASGANLGSTSGTSVITTFPTGTTTGDLVYIVISIGAATSNATISPAGTWNATGTSNATTAMSSVILWRTIGVGDIAPTLNWTTAGKASWVALALAPGTAGTIASHVSFAATANPGTTAASITPSSLVVGSTAGASVLLVSARATAASATAITATAPTGWTEPTNGDQSTAVGTTTATRQSAAEVSYQLGVSGTVTPGAVAWAGQTTNNGIADHAFAIEMLPPITRAQILTKAAVSRSRYY